MSVHRGNSKRLGKAMSHRKKARPHPFVRAPQNQSRVSDEVTTRVDPAIRSVWWWTINRKACRCSECGEHIDKGATIAFDSGPARTVLCEICAAPVSADCRESKRFKAARAA